MQRPGVDELAVVVDMRHRQLLDLPTWGWLGLRRGGARQKTHGYTASPSHEHQQAAGALPWRGCTARVRRLRPPGGVGFKQGGGRQTGEDATRGRSARADREGVWRGAARRGAARHGAAQAQAHLVEIDALGQRPFRGLLEWRARVQASFAARLVRVWPRVQARVIVWGRVSGCGLEVDGARAAEILERGGAPGKT